MSHTDAADVRMLRRVLASRDQEAKRAVRFVIRSAFRNLNHKTATIEKTPVKRLAKKTKKFT